ncbi:JAB domain-containing protein [Bacteroides sp. OttesenSCG-928-D19]|nr:JAB domain-containing protein [Bacteroides sp. OttesenSCG-928-N06]MDL2304840.1 JAB domain-containing protein [Bacteroides sp. OttesenSCG-928-D19]
MSNLFKVSEVKLSYKTKLKASERPKVLDSRTSYNLLMNCYDSETIELKESFKLLLLNRANKVLGVMNVSEGGITGTIVDIKIVLQAAILANASGLIISHNHPSGNLSTSAQDDFITKRIKKACEIMDIELLDHVIVTPDNGYYSYADNDRL